MTKTWLIADTHFDHNNIIEIEKRPFSNKEEMENGLVAAWNNVVQKDHLVYILGDFSFKGVQSWERLLNRLHGEKILIQGNHDKTSTVEKMLDKGLLKELYPVGKYEKIDGNRVYFSHYPLEIGERRNLFNIHGHIHSEMSRHMNQINVGIDSLFMHTYYKEKSVPFGTPVSLDYVLEKIKVISEDIDMILNVRKSITANFVDKNTLNVSFNAPSLINEEVLKGLRNHVTELLASGETNLAARGYQKDNKTVVTSYDLFKGSSIISEAFEKSVKEAIAMGYTLTVFDKPIDPAQLRLIVEHIQNSPVVPIIKDEQQSVEDLWITKPEASRAVFPDIKIVDVDEKMDALDRSIKESMENRRALGYEYGNGLK